MSSYKIYFEPVSDDKNKFSSKSGRSKSGGIKAHADILECFDRNGQMVDQLSLSAWITPGMAPRFTSYEKAWIGNPKVAILLMLMPIACIYQRLPYQKIKIKGTKKWKPNWAVIIPDVRNFADFSEKLLSINMESRFIDIASIGDAGLRFASDYAGMQISGDLEVACRVMALGNVGYYQSQSVRKAILDVQPNSIQMIRWRLLHREFPAEVVLLKEKEPDDVDENADDGYNTNDKTKKPIAWIAVSTLRGRIADNLLCSHSWYEKLAEPNQWNIDKLENERERRREQKGGQGMSIERLLFEHMQKERKKLQNIIKEAEMWDLPEERCFVYSIWQALESLYAKEAEAVQMRGGARSIDERFDDLNEDIRRDLMRCKTRILLREYLCGLFAKAGRRQNAPDVIWQYLNHPVDWKKGRDLALLALASYVKKEKRQEETDNNI